MAGGMIYPMSSKTTYKSVKKFAKKFKKYQKTQRKKRAYKSKASGSGLLEGVTGPVVTLGGYNPSIPFPTRKNVRLVYEMVQNLNSTTLSTGFGASKSFNLNSLFSPESSGGHQPLGFDQLCSATGPYQRYKVNSVKVLVTFFGLAGGDVGTDLGRCYGGVILNNPANSTDIATLTPERVQELPQGQICHIQQYGSSEASIKFYMPMYKMFNLTKLQYSTDSGNTTAPYSAAPGSIPTMKVAICSRDGSTAVVTGYAKVRMIFYASLYERVILNQS